MMNQALALKPSQASELESSLGWLSPIVSVNLVDPWRRSKSSHLSTGSVAMTSTGPSSKPLGPLNPTP